MKHFPLPPRISYTYSGEISSPLHRIPSTNTYSNDDPLVDSSQKSVRAGPKIQEFSVNISVIELPVSIGISQMCCQELVEKDRACPEDVDRKFEFRADFPVKKSRRSLKKQAMSRKLYRVVSLLQPTANPVKPTSSLRSKRKTVDIFQEKKVRNRARLIKLFWSKRSTREVDVFKLIKSPNPKNVF